MRGYVTCLVSFSLLFFIVDLFPLYFDRSNFDFSCIGCFLGGKWTFSYSFFSCLCWRLSVYIPRIYVGLFMVFGRNARSLA